MFTIQNEIIFEQIINKSRFICYLYPITNINEANQILSSIRLKHYDANHNCYCYILGDQATNAKNSDDGEPAKTAGIVIYEVLKKNSLTNIIAIVTRYFGGIKLGSGGLIRAYGSSVSKALEQADLTEIVKKIKISIEFDYSYFNLINKLINTYEELEKTFHNKISIKLLIPLADKDFLIEALINTTNNNIIVTVIDNI